jgi:hypothetical protein
MPPSSPPARLELRRKRFVVRNFVLHFAAVRTCCQHASADFHGFDGLHAHQRLSQLSIQLFVPLRVGAEAHGNVVHHNFKNAADGVACFQRGIHFRFHMLLCCGVHTAQRRIQIFADGANLFPFCCALQPNMANLNYVAGNVRTEFLQQNLGESAGRYARGGFASGSTLQYISRIMEIEFLRTREIGVARARGGELARRCFGRIGCFHRQNLFPIGPVAIFDAQRNGRADGLSVTHSGKNVGAVFLDLLPAAAAVAKLAAVEFVIDEFQVHRQTGRQSRQERKKRLSVRFSCTIEMKHELFSVAATQTYVQRVPQIQLPTKPVFSNWPPLNPLVWK